MIGSNELSDMADDLVRQIDIMKKYLNLKIQIEDWHGVADAACDIRELEIQRKLLSKVRGD